MACHLGPLLGSVILPGVAFATPAVVWAVKGNESPMVKHHAVESVNFQISALLYLVVSVALCLVLIGFVMLAVLSVFYLVCSVLACVKAAAGEPFRYPMTIRFFSA